VPKPDNACGLLARFRTVLGRAQKQGNGSLVGVECGSARAYDLAARLTQLSQDSGGAGPSLTQTLA
jgi:hypothetical protein